jgi:large subunit ribosomal protein L17
MVQLGKQGTLAARRRAAGVIHGDENLHKVFSELAFRYKDRAGGYTRVLATRVRQGDAAPMAFIEFVDRPNELRESKPPCPPPPPRIPLPPWLQSRHARQWAPMSSGL